MPFNYLDKKTQMYDFAAMVVIPVVYYYTFYLAMFENNALMNLPECKNICMLGNAIFIEIGVVSYSINLILSLRRMKRFYPEYYEKLEKIDSALKSCAEDQIKSKNDGEILKKQAKVEKTWLIKHILTVGVLALAFVTAFYFDMSFLEM